MTPPRYDRIGHSKWCTQPQDADKATLDKQKVAHNYTWRYSLCIFFIYKSTKRFQTLFQNSGAINVFFQHCYSRQEKTNKPHFQAPFVLTLLEIGFFTFWNWRACQTQVASAYLVCWLPESKRFCRTLKHSNIDKGTIDRGDDFLASSQSSSSSWFVRWGNCIKARFMRCATFCI